METVPGTKIAEYSKTEAALAELASRYRGVVFAVGTKDGMKLALKARAEIRSYRTSLEALRVEIKAPVLKQCQVIDSEAKRITKALEVLEDPIDLQIRAEERRAQDAKDAAIRAEQERLAAEEKAKKEAEERALAEARAKLEAERAEFQRQLAAQAEVAAKAVREQEELARKARLIIEEEQRAARMRREEEDRAALTAREQADREAREKQERTQAALSEISGIQQQVIIAQVGRAGVRTGHSIQCIRETLAETEAWTIDAESLGVFAGTAAKEKEKAVASIKALLAAAEQREAEDARMKAEREALNKQQAEAEAAQRRVAVANELKEAAERRAQEDRERSERDRLEAVARAKAEEERKARDAEDARQREEQRKLAVLADGYELLQTFTARYGEVEEFDDVTADIKAFLADVPSPVHA